MGMKMAKIDWNFLLQQLAINAVFWVGLVAIASPFLSALFGQPVTLETFFLVFLSLVLLNLFLLLAVQQMAPEVFKQLPILRGGSGRGGIFGGNFEEEGQVSFRMYPVQYPKVLDEELRDFAPEFIHLDVVKGRSIVFGGNIARNALKNFREMVSTVLSVKDVQPPVQSGQPPKPVKKEAKSA